MTHESRIRIAAACAALVIVAAVLIGSGWRDHQRLADARVENDRLAATARELGIQVDAGNDAAFATATPRETTRHRLREDAAGRDARLRDFADRVGATMAELKVISRDGDPVDAELLKRLHGLIYEIKGMTPNDLRALAIIFDAHPGIEEEERGDLASFAMRTLADRHPQAALEMAFDPTSPPRENRLRQNLIGHALERWAVDDPVAALRWFDQHPELHGDTEADMYRAHLIGGVAHTDPAQAFELIDRLGVKNLSAVGNMIVGNGGGDEAGRTNVLAAMRAHLAKSPEAAEAASLRENVIAGLVYRANQSDGATAAIRWFDGAALAPEELTVVANRAGMLAPQGNRPEWLDWFAALDEPKARETGVRTMISQWTTHDPTAAEAWAQQQAPGPARDTAHEVLAGALMQHDPARAMRHAEQLPPGMDRGVQIQLILGAWHARDPDAANAYAQEHGLEW